MKKFYTLVAALLLPLSMYAGGNGVGLLNKTKDSESMLGNGFYFNLGVGLPSYIVDENGADRQKMGVQASIQIGNQWYFVRNSAENFGFGMSVSWLTLGGSSYKVEGAGVKRNAFDVFVNPLRFGPMATYALNDDIAFDAFFDLVPTLHYGQVEGFNSGDEPSHLIFSGATFAPGLKFRYRKLMAGVEYNFGKVSAVYKQDGMDDFDTKVKYSAVRFLIGMKF